MPVLVAFSAELLMRMYHNNPLIVSNTKSLEYIFGNFSFEALNLHREKSTLEKIVPQGLILNTIRHVRVSKGLYTIKLN